MPELRKDYILDRWVIIATERAKRPDQFRKETKKEKAKVDFFAPGNEQMTPKEVDRLERDGKWQIRVFPNKFPAVQAQGNFYVQTHNKFYTFADAFGYHEVLVETPDDRQMWDLSQEELVDILKMYNKRIQVLGEKEGIEYVQVFKNHEQAAGTSIQHSHSQIIAYGTIPRPVRRKIQACIDYGKVPYDEIIEKEKNSHRRCFENETCIAFTPYASRFPFEIWIFPKKHINRLEELESYEDFAEMLHKALGKLKELNAPFNFILNYGPEGTDLHLHLEILPRLTTWAGFEYSGTIINPMPPEDAARFYRGEE